MARRIGDWQFASDLLECAESLTVTHAELMRLSEEVIRARNAITLDKLRIGVIPTPEILRLWARNEALLCQGDDATGALRKPRQVLRQGIWNP